MLIYRYYSRVFIVKNVLIGKSDTLALIKPNAFEKRNEIVDKILLAGFEIVDRVELQLTKEQAEGFYEEHKERPFFGELVEFMISGPIVAMRLRAVGAVKRWRTLMGPTNFEEAKKVAPESIRALYGESMTKNASHGSDAFESAQRELNYFFGPDGVIAQQRSGGM